MTHKMQQHESSDEPPADQTFEDDSVRLSVGPVRARVALGDALGLAATADRARRGGFSPSEHSLGEMFGGGREQPKTPFGLGGGGR